MSTPAAIPDPSIDPASADTPAQDPPGSGRVWLSLLARLLLGVCTVLIALPSLDDPHETAYWATFLLANLIWMSPLTAIQHLFWRRGISKWTMVIALLVITYLMSVLSNLAAHWIANTQGSEFRDPTDWTLIFGGVGGCWLVLIAYCAIQSVITYYADLQDARERNRQALMLAQDAELRALRYQINPHFLFNTLNAISALVAEDRNREAQQMITRLAGFLRVTLDGAEGHEVALADELALTDTYLEIERARLGQRLRLKWNIGPDTLRARVPVLLLQPLVENAIRHGIAQRSEPGRLDIRIEREGDRLHLHVGNDGAPAPAASGEDARRAGAIGLRNIAERLQALYPDAHSFAAGARADGGYEVRMSLPFNEAPAALVVKETEA
ncbi:sensor histidine kinase [Lysobacter sp. cf310]|uniref:sensor histidine kinase n=1 Tax=Lysobacter sp. cf310 TaxID=1761790 RepID=UPI0008E880C9|nr:histidine kinase [Lysobacter sp. cf310]SFK79601.1 two-component system, LytT family, sensor histidine kinase AlgZ [Lysobacter sp. cf310]